MENSEQSSFELILHSGNARSLAYEALGLIKSGKRDDGLELYKNAKAELLQAQKKHSEFLHSAALNPEECVSLLLVHAEDHMNASEIIVELVKEIMELHIEIGDKLGK